MKIVGTQIQQVMAAYRTRSGKADPVSGPAGPADEVRLSERAGEVHKARLAYDALPELREARVEALRTQIQEGSYRLDDTQIARAMLGGAPPSRTEGTPDA